MRGLRGERSRGGGVSGSLAVCEALELGASYKLTGDRLRSFVRSFVHHSTFNILRSFNFVYSILFVRFRSISFDFVRFRSISFDFVRFWVDTIISLIPYDTRIVFDTRYSILALHV